MLSFLERAIFYFICADALTNTNIQNSTEKHIEIHTNTVKHKPQKIKKNFVRRDYEKKINYNENIVSFNIDFYHTFLCVAYRHGIHNVYVPINCMV